MTFQSLFSIAFSLFLLMDPIGNIPVYATILKEIPPKRQRIIIFRELLIALGIIILFNFLGEYLLNIMKIEQSSVLLSGGIILFVIALRMIFPSKQEQSLNLGKEHEPFIVPLAIPLVAGPSVLAAVIIFSKKESHSLVVPAICLAWIASTLILISAPFLKKILGKRGIIACERLMGLILTMISIQMLLEGIDAFISFRGGLSP